MSDPVTFEVVAADEAAEIYLIDGDFRLVDKGIGRKTFTVPPGIYKIKNRSGQTTAERRRGPPGRLLCRTALGATSSSWRGNGPAGSRGRRPTRPIPRAASPSSKKPVA